MVADDSHPLWPPRLEAALEGRYRLISRVGVGGMASVYVAEDLRHPRRVAVKVLLPELAATMGPDRFLREIEVTAALTHPNILPLLDSGTADGTPHYVMPFLDGDSLEDRLKREPQLPLEEAIDITRHVGNALAYAHSKGVVHRDIKPANILFADGQAVVADFGIAKALTEAGGRELTHTGLAVGTPLYMSPEQADTSSVIDGRSDQYSLACVLYRMLVGEAPFTGSNSAAIIARHAVDPVAPPSTVRPGLPRAIDRVIERALSKSQADRYRTTELFIEALERAGSEDAADERAPPQGVRVGLAALAVVVLIAVSSIGVFRTSRDGIRRLAVLPVTLAAEPDNGFLAQGIHSALISELGQVGLTVVGRNSVLRYADGETSTRGIAEELAVEGIVESTVLSTGDDALSVSASLVDVDTEDVLWTGTFAVEVSNLIDVTRSVADSIALEVGLGVSSDVTARRASSGGVDAAAYELFLRGSALLGTLTPAGLDSAMTLFEDAIAIDPGLADAYAGLSSVWGYRQQMGITPPYVAAPEARLAAREAVRLDSLSAATQAVRATNEWHAWDWEAAGDAYRRTLALDPGDARSRAFYAHSTLR